MQSVMGLDTSNYTTSVAIYSENGALNQSKKLLPVKKGEKGLRQSDAVFHHVNQIPLVFDDVMSKINCVPSAVGVSSKPRDENGSYMPCFNVGVSLARVISSLLKIPYFEFSHQVGHVTAASYSAKRLDLLKKEFVAFHVSGGTTEALLVPPDNENVIKTKIIANTLDLNAGQLIDRTGVMLGLDFPAGTELENLAIKYNKTFNIKPTLKGFDCCLSGVENMCKKMMLENQNKEKISRFCIEYIKLTLDKMCESILNEYGDLPVLFAGGVMSNSIIKKYLQEKYNAVFGEPKFSSDNAAGIAVLTAIKSGVLNEY